MGALWIMNNAQYEGFSPELQRVINDGFYQLQQATFASPKRKSIQAYQDFQAGGGDLYVPTPAEKAAFKEAATPVFGWFENNVDGGARILGALNATVAEVEADIAASRASDLN